ncbi:hypothetical protein SLA2020_217310 [Shorea laevis]
MPSQIDPSTSPVILLHTLSPSPIQPYFNQAPPNPSVPCSTANISPNNLTHHRNEHPSAYPTPPTSFKDALVGSSSNVTSQSFPMVSTFHTPPSLTPTFNISPIASSPIAIALSSEEHSELYSPWKLSLIVKPFGKPMEYHFVVNSLRKLWKPVHSFDTIDLDKGFIIVKLSNEDDYSRIFRGGPWFIGQRFLSIRKWEPNF